MRILLLGASGFIGRHLARALLPAHQVLWASRSPPPWFHPALFHLPVDLTRDITAAAWLPRLEGVDAVVNAAGLLRESGTQSFEAIHVQAPIALFDACVRAGVRRVVQVSALGADDAARSRYHLSKKTADDHLRRLPLSSVIVQPSLVFGADGTSAALFCRLASLPWVPVPGSGRQQVQPVHVDDVVDALRRLIEAPEVPPRLNLTGPAPVALGDFLGQLRSALGLAPARCLPVPMPLVRAGAALGHHLPGLLLDRETLGMLERGNTAPCDAFAQVLGRQPRPPSQFITGGFERRSLRESALLWWLLPLLRVAIALVWIVTGVVSAGLYPVADSLALLARVGLQGPLALLMLYGAAALDLLLGVLTLLSSRRWLWRAQIALILGYTLIITVWLPEFWLHPYGPVLKNLPMLAALWLLLALDRR